MDPVTMKGIPPLCNLSRSNIIPQCRVKIIPHLY
jgi:hypothetical protein